ncbi:MAG: threonine synthase [Clostridiales bacterium]|nr:threonine synthase [Clostridiales bacterium]
MKYISTRGHEAPITSAAAIIRGLALDRGLYVPETIPALPLSLRGANATKQSGTPTPYAAVAHSTLAAFFTDFADDELNACVTAAYDEKFDAPDITPIVKTENAYFLELWHGSTAAFKDMALSILPWLLKTAARKEGEDKKIAILTATSGDTGKAALAGFADVPGTEIIVFYPKDGVSVVQERQMLTQEGANVHVYGIRGNFDEAQTGVKSVFADAALAEGLADRGVRLSSANSINIGRLVPQVAYYINAYAKLVAQGEVADGERINVCVPTGNFGNILAAWYAKQMGLPIAKLICASNENKILTDFINTGVYDTRRDFILTSSPSMDILVSSNLERLLFHLSGGDAERIRALMGGLEENGVYDVGAEAKSSFSSDFYGGYAEMAMSHVSLARLWREESYLMDTHTAVAYAVYMDYRARTGDTAKTLIASTASPYKFAGSVAGALGIEAGADEFATLGNLEKSTGIAVPRSLRGLEGKPVLHDAVIEKTAVKAAVTDALFA